MFFAQSHSFPHKERKKNSIAHFPFHSTAARQIKYIQLSYPRLLFPHPFFGRSSRCPPNTGTTVVLYWRRREGSQTPQLFPFAVPPPGSETCETKHRRAGDGAAALLYVLDFSIADETKVLYLACHSLPSRVAHTSTDCKHTTFTLLIRAHRTRASDFSSPAGN